MALITPGMTCSPSPWPRALLGKTSLEHTGSACDRKAESPAGQIGPGFRTGLRHAPGGGIQAVTLTLCCRISSPNMERRDRPHGTGAGGAGRLSRSGTRRSGTRRSGTRREK